MILTFVYADLPHELNTSIHRCFTLTKAVNHSGRGKAALLPLLQFNQRSEMAENYCSHSDIIVVERNLFADTLDTIRYWKDKGKIIVANFDDAYDLIKPNNISYRLWKKGEYRAIENGREVTKVMSPVSLEQFKQGLKLCDAAVMPSRVLVKDWAKYTPTLYLPNYLDVAHYQKFPKVESSDITIGWGGSLGHLQSFMQIGLPTVLSKVARAHDNVKIMIAGVRALYDMIDLPEGKKIFQPFVPFEEWPGVLARFDIGVAPLCGSYDNRRSWLKPLEYMTMQIPWVGSNVEAYSELGTYGRLVKNDASEWLKVLTGMVDHLDEHRAHAAGAPYEFAMRQNADDNADAILGVFQQIYDNAKVEA